MQKREGSPQNGGIANQKWSSESFLNHHQQQSSNLSEESKERNTDFLVKNKQQALEDD